MAKNSDSKDLFDFELPEGLDDDLGGDWESAFQAEDFMLTPEDEAEIFFEKEGGVSDDLDLASLLESDDSQPKHSATISPGSAEEEIIAGESKKALSLTSFLPAALIAILARYAGWFQSRPFYQKILFPSLVFVSVLFLCAIVFFFRSTSQQLAEQQPPALAPPFETKAPTGQKDQADLASFSPQQTLKQPAPTTPSPGKNRKKWPMQAFFIAVQQKDSTESLLVRIDLNLVLLLDPGSNIPEEKRAFVRNTIFQFFANRPPEELRRYSLARGEMLRNLDAWLQKEWPQNPIASIMFDRYQILN